MSDVALGGERTGLGAFALLDDQGERPFGGFHVADAEELLGREPRPGDLGAGWALERLIPQFLELLDDRLVERSDRVELLLGAGRGEGADRKLDRILGLLDD